MNLDSLQIGTKRRTRSERVKEAVLASFCKSAEPARALLSGFTARDWERARFWLDVSGLALYFLDRLVALDITSCIPASMLHQLQQKLADNRLRTASLLKEALRITEALADRGVKCALLKGITLPSESVPDCALRVQMDLDLLVRHTDAERVKNTLAVFGYALDAVSGNTWEFKAGRSGQYGMKHMYQVRLERALDLHVIPAGPHSDDARLSRAQRRLIHGHLLPALSPADLFVYQARHLFKHICSDHVRASWVLEYWRHVCARRDDAAFWREVIIAADQDPGTRTAIGAATLLTSHVFGSFAPDELLSWSVEPLASAIGIWIQLYWRRVLLSDTPRHKLYLLLLKELSRDPEAEQQARRRSLVPIQWPQRITRPIEGETLADRLHRHWTQVRFSLHRLRFHLVEGIGVGMEWRRWNRCIAEVSR